MDIEKKLLSINSGRLQNLINDFAKIGKTKKGGVTRLALSNEDKEARDLFVKLAKEAGCSIKVDAMGNIFARRKGKDNSLAPVLTGSHIDSQPQGGRFDGIYGVLAGLEAIYTLNDNAMETLRPIDLVSWTNEEGARFAPAMIGSAVFAGITPIEDAWRSIDDKGLSLKSELDRIGYLGNDDFSGYKPYASLEIHIEQGPLLENNNKVIGAVTSTFGIKWFDVQFNGVAAHSGTTPMSFRKDALIGLALAVEKIKQIGERHTDARATVGKVDVKPNSRNVIPSQAWFSVEFRHPSMEVLELMERELNSTVKEIAEELELSFKLTPVLTLQPVIFNTKCVDLIRDTAEKLGYPYQYIISGAGHDSCNVNKMCPTSMIFIPCIEGISHNEAEDIKPEWGIAGANVLVNSLTDLANKP